MADLAPYMDRLADAYHRYVTTVSHPHHAASLEAAALIWWHCDRTQPESVCDLGSGFSSYVLRRYAAEAERPVVVHSVDTDPEWLAKSVEFAGDPTGFLSFDEWEQLNDRYGVIFHDIANGSFREAAMWTAADRLTDNGTLIFDDAHHDGHRAEMERVARHHGWTLSSARDVTLDGIGRFAMVATTEPATLASEFERLCHTPSDIYQHLPTFYDLVVSTDAQHVVELGTRTGVSTVAWLHGLDQTGGRLTSVDIDPQPDIAPHPRWEFIQGDDCDPDIIARIEPADIVFIDTSHLYEHTLEELNIYQWVCRTGGAIVCHDTELERPEGAPAHPRFPVKKAVAEFCERMGYRWVNHPNCFGLAVIEVV